MNYADLLLTIYGPQKREILKLRSASDLLAYAQQENLNFSEEQAEKLILKIKQYNKEITDEEMNSDAFKSRITSETPCRYCGSKSTDLSVDSYCIYLTCASCKCNIIEI